jgi:glycerol-3-phosphate dehydrogenase
VAFLLHFSGHIGCDVEKKERVMLYDVVVIGAGVTGAFIARELSRYELKVCMLEKETDVSMGTSKANSAIVHAGFDAVPNSLKAQLNVRGNKRMPLIAQELGVDFKQIGSFVLCHSKEDIPKLEELMKRGISNGVEGLEIITGDRLKAMEPNITAESIAALYAPTAGIICPYELTLHAAENAVENGVDLKLGHEVTSIRFDSNIFIISSAQDEFKAKFIVNAAGLYADTVSMMAGDNSFSIKPRRGEYVLFDKAHGNLVNRVIFQLPSAKGKGVLVTPTVDGNLLVGPNAEEIKDKQDTATTCSGLSEILRTASLSVSLPSTGDIITSFAGLRAGADTGDFIIRASEGNKRFIHAAGIESPGLTAAPAIGERVVKLLEESGLRLVQKTNYNPSIKYGKAARHMTGDELNKLIRQHPEFGRIVCRCEKITEGEILSSIHRTIGATNLDAVKRRTRAGMGRCQGGFCSSRVVEILSRELKVPAEEITKFGGNSRLLMGRTKHNLETNC